MARQCVKLVLGDKVAKLRLTLKSQKLLREKYPEESVMMAVMGAVDEPEAMEFLLTLALNFDGNDNEIRDGAELYDLMVDCGYSGQEDFLALAMDIAKNAGLVTQDDKDKLRRVVAKQIRRGMDRLESAFEDEPSFDTLDGETTEEEGEEGPENPPRTLDN